MYELASRLDPICTSRSARATYGEMALAGITCVGEFHYLHHGPDGTPYADPNAMGRAVIQAAREAGIRITLLDACYLHGGIGEELAGAQRRFGDGDADRWAERVGELEGDAGARGSARRSTASARSIPSSAAVVAAWAGEREAPLHAHVSEQPAENERCLEAYRATPDRDARPAPARSAERFDGRPRARTSTTRTSRSWVSAGATCCLCPTTERDLADGIGPARAAAERRDRRSPSAPTPTRSSTCSRRRAPSSSTSGSTPGERGRNPAGALLDAATDAGHRCLGWPDAGRIEPGAMADLVTRGPRHAADGGDGCARAPSARSSSRRPPPT